MIRTAKNARSALVFGYHRRGVMAADVVERAELIVAVADYDDRLACQLRRDELPGPLQLIGARHDLPGAPKYRLAFQFGDALVHVPRRQEWWTRDQAWSWSL